ncbi:MAG: hypothetical protein JNN03_03245 [Rubrivivax sp.]|nr:hypothetical protein [Rubrivivax sp.]
MSSWIVDAARRQAGKQLAVSAIVLGVLVTLLGANWGYVREYFRGAHPVSAQELIGAAPSTRGWIRVQADKLHATGLQVITVRKKRGIERSRSVSTEFFVAEVGNRLLLVRGVPGQTALLEGTLAPPDPEAMSRLLDKPESRATLSSRFLPQMMDTHDYAGSATIWLPVGGLLALAALVWGGLGLARWRQPTSHPAVKPFVANQSLPAASASIERDIANAKTVKVGATTLTRRFVITQSLTKLDIQPATQLLWAFKQVTQKKMYYVIPAGKTYAAVLNFESGTVTLGGKEAVVDKALAFLTEHAPWAMYGHSPEIAAVYKDKRQREQLKAHVRSGIEKARAAAAAAATTTAATPAGADARLA